VRGGSQADDRRAGGVCGCLPATLPRARALAAAATLLETTDGYAIAGDYCEEGLAIARAAGDEYVVADLLHQQASVLVRQGQPSTALPLIEGGCG
jgi:hypothetical protein